MNIELVTPQERATWDAYERYGTYRAATNARLLEFKGVEKSVPPTVPMFKKVLSNLYHKLGAKSGVHASRLMREAGMFPYTPPPPSPVKKVRKKA